MAARALDADGSERRQVPDARVAPWTPPRFFDAAGGLPPNPECQQWLGAAWSSVWADPAGRHAWAARSSAALAEARSRFANHLHCSPGEVAFAPNPDAALATAVVSLAGALPDQDEPSVLVSPLERLAVMRTCDGLPAAVRELPVDTAGRIDLGAFAAGHGQPRVVIVQAANREIGTVQDIDAIADAAGPRAVLLVDATAVRRRSDLPLRWDALVLDPTMWGGPSGLAVVACRSATAWAAAAPATLADRFPGRPPVPLVAAAAMSLPDEDAAEAEEQRIASMARRFADRLSEAVPMAVVLGSREHGLAHIVGLSLLYVNAEQLLDDLGRLGFAVASGSACTSDTRRPSHVLTAIGALTHGNLRVSLPPGCPGDEVDQLVAAVAELVRRQRSEAGVL